MVISRQSDAENFAVKRLVITPRLDDPIDSNDGDIWYRSDLGKLLVNKSGTIGDFSKIIGEVANALADLSDVTITDPTDGQVLKFDNGSGKWVNSPDSGGGLVNTDGLPEGSTNLYYSNERVQTYLNTLTSDDIAEGASNLYYTAIRVTNLVESMSLSDLEPAATDLSLNNHKIHNVDDPQNPQDAATKAYVDGHVGSTNFADNEILTGVRDNSNKTFTALNDIIANSEHLFVNQARKLRSTGPLVEVPIDPGDNESPFGNDNPAALGFQTFTITRDGSFIKYVLYVDHDSLNSSTGIHVEVQGVSGGQPDGTVYDAVDINTSSPEYIYEGQVNTGEGAHYARLERTLATPLGVSNGDQYCLVITSQAVGTGGWSLIGWGESTYSDGTWSYDAGGSPEDEAPVDLCFQIFLAGGDGGDYTWDSNFPNQIVFTAPPAPTDILLIDYRY